MNRRERMHHNERQPRNRERRRPQQRPKPRTKQELPLGLGKPTTWGAAICAGLAAGAGGAATLGICALIAAGLDSLAGKNPIADFHCQIAAMIAAAIFGLIGGGIAMFLMPAFFPEDDRPKDSAR